MDRVDIKKILKDPKLRREISIRSIIAIQAREGIDTTYEQAASAYDKIQAERHKKGGNSINAVEK